MDQEHKIIIITKKLKQSKLYNNKEEYYTWDKKTREKIKRRQPQEVLIYDITATKKFPKKEIFYVNDHVNKTGKNPLISKKENKTQFYDITNMYHETKKGITTTCLGKRYKKEQDKFKYPSTTICHVVFILRSNGYKKIKGWLIPES